MTKRKGGRQAYQPTDRDREQVKVLVTAGVQCKIIAQVIGISPNTLSKHFQHEISTSKHMANARVAAALFKSAVESNNVTAQIFWLKTQAGWRETIAYEGKQTMQIEEAKKVASKFAPVVPPGLKVVK